MVNESDSSDGDSRFKSIKQQKRNRRHGNKNDHDETIVTDAKKKRQRLVTDSTRLKDVTNLPSTSTKNKRRRRN